MLPLVAALHATVQLTPDNWEAHIGSKKVFVKFLAPW